MTEEQTDTNEFRAQRLANMQQLMDSGHQVYGAAYERTGSLSELAGAFEEEKPVRAAGRLIAMRDMGKSIFAHLQDGTGKFQIYVRKNGLEEQAFLDFKQLDLGDHIGVEGTLFTTRTGEPTIKVSDWTMLSKALLPLPEKWHGLQDVEMRYRQRYLDLVANPEVMDLFRKRTEAIRTMRAYLAELGYYEVETPMIQGMAGGAAANPFKTHYEALNVDMFLRIAPELYLKRLLVGGFDKVFELNRNFRNEGLSRSHNPEFTMLEIYAAYSDMRGMQALIQGMVTHVAETIMGTLQVGSEDMPIDLTTPWAEKPYEDLIREAAGDDWFDLARAEAEARAKELGVDVDPAWSDVELTQELFEKKIEKTLINPTFVTRLPKELVPLAKSCPDNPELVDVFELIIGGREVAPAYSELNDPLEQRKRFEEQAAGAAEKVDEDFLTALEHGMPPAGGMGVGIDRLMMVLTGAEAIRDVILFPQLKPRKSE